nr:Rab3 GTPase-activating protein catalytic subunit [Tanacetum cinerariifolium]
MVPILRKERLLGSLRIKSWRPRKMAVSDFQVSMHASFRRSVRDGVERQQWDDLNYVSRSVTLSASKDRWTCDLNGDGVFRVKEVRTILDDIFLPSAADATRWVKYIPIKINVFAWRVRLDRLLTRSNIVRRGVVLDSSLCLLCGLVPEDIHHVLFRCDTAKLVFRRICHPIYAVVPKIMVTRPRHAHSIDTKSKSTFRRHMTCGQSSKTSNTPPRVTAAQAPVLRRLWSEGQHIPGIPADKVPDLNCCLLYQQLQVINCCISRKHRRAIATESLDSILTQANFNGDVPTLNGETDLMYARVSSGELVLRLGADKQCENLTLLETGEPVYAPVMQEQPLLTEDLVKETEEFILRTGSVGAGCSQLLSDMQAFKAANPGCILEDFVRWHSPPDWMEPPSDDESKESVDGDSVSSRGHLSMRMQKEGNLWREIWETAKPVPAVKQSPLYDEDLSVEEILHGLEDFPPSDFFEQLYISLLCSACVVAETRTSTNEYLYKLFLECKDYIVATCQGKSWFEKVDDICQVYDTVVMMVSNPDEFIRLTKHRQGDDAPTAGEQKGRFRRLSFVFGNKDKNLGKTPPKDPKSVEENPLRQSSENPLRQSFENPLRQSISSMFSKKPPRAGSASPAEKPVSSIQNDWIDV